ncbi:hypothetical protein H4S06_001765 [Coemansia sp. BCRC 34490]|nr:hypothetical protein H4S06_001765 [Coemansia sp. BCRC 34490]
MSSRLPAQRNATSPVSPLPPTQPPQPPLQSQGKQEVDGAKEGDRRRRRAARRQSEDPMHAMRSLDRQYGRRRRLNSDYHGCEGDDRHGSGKYNAVELLGELTTVGHKKSLGGASGKASLSLASASTSAVSAFNASSGSSMLKRGDSRTLFAAPFCRPHAETVTAFSGRPPSAGVGSSAIGDTAAGGDVGAQPVATTRRSAHQLMLLADRIAQQQQQVQVQVQVQGGGAARLVAATAPSVISAATGVRPRASMPLINGVVPRRGPQRTRSQATRNKRGGIGGGGGGGDDELSDALTMKSVEIRGGRIVLDNPSSSEESDGSDSETSHGSGSGRGGGNGMEMEIEASRLFGTNRHHYHYQQQRRRRTSSGMAVAAGSAGSVGGSAMAQRQSITSSVCSAQSADAAAAAAGATHWAWDEVLRRQWYTRRCLGLRQPFDSVHRLAKAEHDSAAPFPLLNDLRRVLVETRGCAVSVDGAAPEPADVLLCTDAIVVCATRQQQQDQNQPDQRGRLHAVEFGDELCVQLADDAAGRTVCITGGEDSLTQQQQKLVVEFPSSGSARAWMDQAMQARTRLDSALQDLRLDEEDYVDRPPLPLLARGRSSIAGTGAANVSLGPSTPLRMRNAAHGGVYWVPDGEAAACMVCRKTVFSMMVRRHHCRACGLVICYRCSAVATDSSDSKDSDSVRRRLCVRCWRQRKMPPAASSSSALALALVPVDAPRHSPSLMTLGRRAAEYLPAGDIVMQLAAQHEAAAPPIPPVRKKPDRLARRPISSLFPLAAAAEPEPDASPAG